MKGRHDKIANSSYVIMLHLAKMWYSFDGSGVCGLINSSSPTESKIFLDFCLKVSMKWETRATRIQT